MIRFFAVLLAVAVAIALFTPYAHQQGWMAHLPSFFYETLIFLVFGTGLIFVYLYRNTKPDFFLQLYLLTMVVKFLAYGAYCFFVILEDGPGAVPNVVFFMIVYFLFTVLEIAFLYRKISAASRS